MSGYRIMAIMSPFQGEDASSTLATRSIKKMNKYTLIGSITFLIALSEIAFLLCLWVFEMTKMNAI